MPELIGNCCIDRAQGDLGTFNLSEVIVEKGLYDLMALTLRHTFNVLSFNGCLCTNHHEEMPPPLFRSLHNISLEYSHHDEIVGHHVHEMD